MTTIAFKNGVMAADSMTSFGSTRFALHAKIYRLTSGALLGTAGNSDSRDVIALLDTCHSPEHLPSRQALEALHSDFTGLIAFRNGGLWMVRCDWTTEYAADGIWAAQVIECSTPYLAIGSGSDFAIGAMAAGCTAAKAVEVACRFDAGSGPPVHTASLKKPR